MTASFRTWRGGEARSKERKRRSTCALETKRQMIPAVFHALAAVGVSSRLAPCVDGNILQR